MALPDTCVEDIFRCVSYLLVMPVIMAAGLIGSFATFFVLSGPKFQSDTFFYLRALSLSDMMYLLAAFGYIYEIFFLQSFASVTTAAKESSTIHKSCKTCYLLDCIYTTQHYILENSHII